MRALKIFKLNSGTNETNASTVGSAPLQIHHEFKLRLILILIIDSNFSKRFTIRTSRVKKIP